jgi:hypothetical protein
MSDAAQTLDASRRMLILRARLALRGAMIRTVLREREHAEIIVNE